MASLFKTALAAFAVAMALPASAHAASVFDTFNCRAGFADSLASVKTLTQTGQDGGSEEDYDWESTLYAPPAGLTVFGFYPTSLEYYWEEDMIGASDGFAAILSTSFGPAQQAVLTYYGVSACARMNKDACVIEPSSGAGTIEVRPLDSGGAEISCWFDD